MSTLHSTLYFWPTVTWLLLGLITGGVARLAGTLTVLEFLFCLVAWPAIVYLGIVKAIKREREHKARVALYQRALKDIETRLDKACIEAGIHPARYRRKRR